MWAKAVWKLVTMSVLLVAHLNQCRAEKEITVDPPRDLQIMDPGHLGQLHVHWALPTSLENVTDCMVRFQLQYFDYEEERWRAVRTVRLSYSIQFDLEKDIRVKVQTMLRGPCTGGASELQSPPAELHLQPPKTGPPDSKIEGLSCIFYQKEYMDCTWTRGRGKPYAKYHLYFWHEGMEQAAECPEYLHSHGRRHGCRFPGDTLLEFTEFNVCVNGSSSGPLLQPAYFTMQLQNHVKPAAIDVLSLEPLPGGGVCLEWVPPKGKIPEDCLEFEVESVPEGKVGPMLRNVTRELSLIVPDQDLCGGLCFWVRSRVHQFCSDDSFWSEWSHTHCLPESPDCLHTHTEAVILCATAIVIIMLFSLAMCWLVYRKIMKNRKEDILL
ncbi:interleukin-13 receptor subunit alpha-2 [Megalops cyprinoides]|uniref:interleukin-13 receptor subunit alpha-2 n=1 Tax=Megalops cyprinoides TaxID=118141 RepID=UPI001864C7CE|nr:interleukin-13 receptor subunit alpha-2 [Megalops cyprinoides]XP_036404378.1 interleukin-13 receptor subunit alpha-2 [Megalops cyprinoides]XP_036404379.1 interleukin-13 receptor subunit alpha-2 [Megalops cyprinoides]